MLRGGGRVKNNLDAGFWWLEAGKGRGLIGITCNGRRLGSGFLSRWTGVQARVSAISISNDYYGIYLGATD